MNQQNIGKFIAHKRKEKNLTQEKLAESIGVSNKTISKWENGKCMPDYSIIEDLCDKLEISITELLDGEEKEEKSFRMYDEEETLNLIKDTEDLKEYSSCLAKLIFSMLIRELSHIIDGPGILGIISTLLLLYSIFLGAQCVWIAYTSLKRKRLANNQWLK